MGGFGKIEIGIFKKSYAEFELQYSPDSSIESGESLRLLYDFR